MDQLALEFKQRALAVRATPRARYPEDLRRMAVEYVDAAKQRGVSLFEAARALGVDYSTVGLWRRRLAQDAAPGGDFRPVKIVPDSYRHREEILVRGPNGLEISGLDVVGVAALVRLLT